MGAASTPLDFRDLWSSVGHQSHDQMPLAACLIGATDIEPFYSEERRNAVFLGRLINDQEREALW
jgi:hypothetical protein